MTWLQHYNEQGEKRALQLVDDRHWNNNEVILTPTRLVVWRNNLKTEYDCKRYKISKIGETVHIRPRRRE